MSEVTVLAHVIARYAYTLGGETTDVEQLIPIAATLNGKVLGWGRKARPLPAPALRLAGVMVALDPPDVRYVLLAEATQRMKPVPLAGDTVLTARDLGVRFGD